MVNAGATLAWMRQFRLHFSLAIAHELRRVEARLVAYLSMARASCVLLTHNRERRAARERGAGGAEGVGARRGGGVQGSQGCSLAL